MKTLRFIFLTLFAFVALGIHAQEACQLTTPNCKPTPECKPSPSCPPICCEVEKRDSSVGNIQEIEVPEIKIQLAWKGLRKEQAEATLKEETLPTTPKKDPVGR